MTKGLITSKKIGVLMGGLSAERDVSMRSGLAIYQSLLELGYNATAIDVGKDIVNVLKKEKVRFAFMALHGGMGENGAMQGMLEVAGIPYTGSGVLASALAMDKEISKKIFSYHELPIPSFKVVTRDELKVKRGQGTRDKGQEISNNNSSLVSRLSSLIDFPLPWVVKPAGEGSSIGVTMVRDEAMLSEILEKTLSFGGKAIIEKFIEGKEIHIGILGNEALGGVEVRPSLEFYNYEAKYTSGLTEYILPPEIDDDSYEKLKSIALQAHTALGCSGASRVDLKMDGNGTPFVLEVNTLPGMTSTSLLPKIARSKGMDFKKLIEEMMKIAIKEK